MFFAFPCGNGFLGYRDADGRDSVGYSPRCGRDRTVQAILPTVDGSAGAADIARYSFGKAHKIRIQ